MINYSYKSEIKYLDLLNDFICEIMTEQKRRETNISNEIKDYLELKYRKINEHINKKWEYKKQDKRTINANNEVHIGNIKHKLNF